ncbi:MAG: glycosyltransferase [Planctomycetota bacterium]
MTFLKPENIAEAVNRMLADLNRYDEMKRNAVRAVSVHNWNNESKKLLAIYHRLEDEINVTSN